MIRIVTLLVSLFLTACGTVPQELSQDGPSHIEVCSKGEIRAGSLGRIESFTVGERYRILGKVDESGIQYYLAKADYSQTNLSLYFLVHPTTGEISTAPRMIIPGNAFTRFPQRTFWLYDSASGTLKVKC
jgi:hypothetical protein